MSNSGQLRILRWHRVDISCIIIDMLIPLCAFSLSWRDVRT